MFRRLELLVVCWLGLWFGAARAICPGEAGEPVPQDPAELATLSAELAEAAGQCDSNPLFLAYRGAVFLALGRAADAATWLELALLHAPDLPVAQIDYARALTQLGDRSSAAAIWRGLLARDDLPPHLREEIRLRLVSLDRIPAESPLWRQRGEIALRAGYDSNLKSASSAREITLTFPGVDITVPIAASAQPAAGSAALMDARWQAARTFEGGRELDLRASLKLRGAPTVAGAGYRQADIEANGYQRVNGGDWTVSIGLDDVLFGGQHLLQSVRASVMRTWAANICGRRIGIDSELRSYPSSPVLDGHYSGLVLGLACLTYADVGLGLVARAGIDDPQHARPGGEQVLADVRAQATRSFLSGTLQLSLAWQGERDREGYSPLLSNGAPRSIRRTTFGFEWSRPLALGWVGLLGAETVRQRSNLSLFELQGASVQIGAKRAW